MRRDEKLLMTRAFLTAALFAGCGNSERGATPATNEAALTSPRVAIYRIKGAASPLAADPVANGLNYNGGTIMSGTVNVYYIFYGTWAAGDQTILTDFARNIAPSPYYHINTGYYDSTGKRVANSVVFAGSTTDNYSRGKALVDADIPIIVNTALANNALPKDTNGVYFVLTATDVTEKASNSPGADTFCGRYCGWHTYGTISSTEIKYSFIGDASVQCPGSCRVHSTSPNGRPGPDAVASVIAHELEESTTDPHIDAWVTFTPLGAVENADMCADSFTSTYTAPNGSTANVHLGTRDFLIQDNWVNQSGGFCSQRTRAAGDITADFRSDVALAGGVGWNTVPVAKSNGDGTFTVTNLDVADFPVYAQQPGAKLIAGDFDNDGRSDLALTGGSSNGVSWNTLPVAFSNGDGTFRVTNLGIADFGTYATQPGAKPITGDFDGDGRVDVALTGGSSNGVAWNTLPVAFSNGDGTFRVTNLGIADFGTYATQPGAKPITGDFDGDGRTDIALTGGSSNGASWNTLPVAFSNGDGTFRVTNLDIADFGTYATQPGAIPVAGDFDGDGRGDVALTSGSSNGVSWNTLPVAFSNGDGTFRVTNLDIADFGTYATQPGAKPVWGDFNGDGRGDVALTGGSSNGVPWNTLPVAFSNGDGTFAVTNLNITDFASFATQSGVQPVGG